MKPRIKIVYKKTATSFHGRYKGYLLNLFVDEANGCWYIIVTALDGCYAYDGWWRDSEYKTVDEAILEAIRGAGINQ